MVSSICNLNNTFIRTRHRAKNGNPGRGDDCDRSQAERRREGLRRYQGPARHQAGHPEPRVRGLRRPLGLRQVHAAAHDRRAGGHHPGRASASAAGDVNDLAPADRGVAMVFQSYALYPHMTRRREHRLRPEDGRRRPRPRSTAASRTPPESCSSNRCSSASPRPALRRPAPARRHRPRHRPRAGSLPLRRAAVQPRRRAPRPDARRDRQAARRPRGDDDLCHPRPGRGDDPGRPHRRPQQGPYRAGRLAAGALPPPRATASSPASSAPRR